MEVIQKCEVWDSDGSITQAAETTGKGAQAVNGA